MTSHLSFLKSDNSRVNFAAALLLSLILVLNLLSVRHKTNSYDEKHHYRYGMKILRLDPVRSHPFDDSKMPFSCFNALPARTAEILGMDRRSSWTARILYGFMAARIVTMLFSVLLGFYVFQWSRELYGNASGIFSLILYAFSPNILAHSQHVTSDLYAALMIALSLYTFWKFLNTGGWKNAAWSAVILGVSQLAKYTCVYLYPIFLLIALIKHGLKPLSIRVFLKYALFFIAVSIFIINAGFIFNRSFTSLGEYHFRSHLFQSLQSQLKVIDKMSIPLPYPYLDGLDQVAFHESHESDGKNHGSVYLMGKLAEPGHGFKGYFFWAYLFKEPIALQLILAWSLVVYWRRREKWSFRKNELFLLLPILFFTVYFNFFFNTQIGIRYILVIFPLLYIFCGSLLRDWGTMGWKIRGIVAPLVLYLAISVLSYYPHFLPYFNEFVWDRKGAYKILADSNIDWGQGGWYLQEYVRKNPNVIIEPRGVVAGRIIVSASSLAGIRDPKRYQWLRDNFEPVDQIAYSYLVYDVKREDLIIKGLV